MLKKLINFLKKLFIPFKIDLNSKYKNIYDLDDPCYIYFPIKIENNKVSYNVFGFDGKEYYFLCSSYASKFRWKINFIKI